MSKSKIIHYDSDGSRSVSSGEYIPKAELSEIADRIRVRIRRTVEDIVETGRDLTRVKASLDHGEFGEWIEREFGMTDRTARNYMQAAALFEGKTEIVSDMSPTTLYLLAAPSTPKAVADNVIARAEQGETIKAAEVKRQIKKAKADNLAKQPAHTREELAGKINRSWQDANESASALGESIAAAKEELEPEVLPPESARRKLSRKPSKKPRKPTKAQLQKRQERLEQGIESFLPSQVESIDLGFFSPTGDHLHPDDFYPAIDAYLDAATAAKLIKSLTETQAAISGWIDQLRAVADPALGDDDHEDADGDNDPLAIPPIFKRDKEE